MRQIKWLRSLGAMATSLTSEVAWDQAGELVTRAAAGSTDAWSQLVDRFAPVVLAIARRHGLADTDVDDVHQIVWLRLAENLRRLDDPRRVAGWLATTTRNESLRVIDQAKRLEPVREFGPAHEDVEGQPGVGTRLARDETAAAVAGAFAALDDRCRHLLRSVVIDADDYEVVARRFDMPIGSIGPTRRRCLDRLRKLLPAAEVTFQ